MHNTVAGLKEGSHGLINKTDTAKKRTSELEGRSVELSKGKCKEERKRQTKKRKTGAEPAARMFATGVP